MILTFDQLQSSDQKLIPNNQKLVLVGGCFDILHSGHIDFLREAKAQGDLLAVLLENDISIRHKKGLHRPVNSQLDRAKILIELRSVDIVICMPEKTKDTDYYKVTQLLKPAIIATTKGDPYRDQKEVCAQAAGAQVIDVINHIPDRSSSRIVDLLVNEGL